jgi:hypothetical protein
MPAHFLRESGEKYTAFEQFSDSAQRIGVYCSRLCGYHAEINYKWKLTRFLV